jgi:flavin reductase (DIM6/NTAB) family NADH-FMN oxidoreductase RutF
MTASWGGLGVLWNKPVATVYVRPQRYTFELAEKADRFALCILPEGLRDALKVCGTKSGRDTDKIATCALKFTTDNQGAVFFDDAVATLKLKKLYAQDMQKECFIDTSPLKFYENGGLHRIYICEVIE